MDKTFSRSIFLRNISLPLSRAFLALMFAASTAAAEVQVLDLAANGASPTLPGGDLVEKACGEYSLAAVRLQTVPSTDPAAAAGGEVKILDSDANPIAVRQIPPGQTGKLSVVVKLDQEQTAQDLQIRLLTSAEPEQVLERGFTDDAGNVEFSKRIPPGDYKVALVCNEGGFLAGAATGAAGIAAAALGLSNSSGGSQGVLFNSEVNANPPPADSRPSASDVAF